MVTFEEMNLDPAILKALNEMNIITPTPVQEQAIPVILESIDANVFAQAKTGSGKTLSFWYSDRRTIGSRAEKGSSSDFSPDS